MFVVIACSRYTRDLKHIYGTFSGALLARIGGTGRRGKRLSAKNADHLQKQRAIHPSGIRRNGSFCLKIITFEPPDRDPEDLFDGPNPPMEAVVIAMSDDGASSLFFFFLSPRRVYWTSTRGSLTHHKAVTGAHPNDRWGISCSVIW